MGSVSYSSLGLRSFEVEVLGHALQADHAATGQRHEQSTQARPGDLQGGLQLRGGPIRGGRPRPSRGLERRGTEVREKRQRQLGPEGQLTRTFSELPSGRSPRARSSGPPSCPYLPWSAYSTFH